MSAYLSSPARPLLLVADSTEIRATDPTQLKPGQCALFTAAGGNYRKLASWDALSTTADDGTSVWRPTAIAAPDPGRFVVLGTSDATPNTYALRDGSGNVPGAGGSDFSARVAHVNWATGANDAVPTLICGLSVDRGSSGGVERARSGIFWNEGTSEMILAQDTAGDDTTVSGYLPLRAGGLRAPSGEASGGFVRMSQGDEIRARLGASSYRLIAGLSGPIVAVGDSGVANTTVDADSDVTITSRIAGVGVRAATAFSVKDASGLNTLIDASVGAGYLKLYGDLTAYNGGTAVLDVDVSSALTKASGRFQVYDQIGSVLLLDANSAASPATVATYGLLNAVRAGLATTAATGFLLQNTTASSIGVPIQYAPSEVDEGRVRVSGADRAMRMRRTLQPRTSGALDHIHEYDTGSGYSEAYRFTTSTTGQFTAALQSYSIAFGNALFHDGTNSGLFMNGADSAMHIKNREGKGLWYSDEDLEIQTGGANARMYFDASGNQITVTATDFNVVVLSSDPVVVPYGATVELDLDATCHFEVVLTGNATITTKNGRDGTLVTLLLTQASGGAHTVTFNNPRFEDWAALAAELTAVDTRRSGWIFRTRTQGGVCRLVPFAPARASIVVP